MLGSPLVVNTVVNSLFCFVGLFGSGFWGGFLAGNGWFFIAGFTYVGFHAQVLCMGFMHGLYAWTLCTGFMHGLCAWALCMSFILVPSEVHKPCLPEDEYYPGIKSSDGPGAGADSGAELGAGLGQSQGRSRLGATGLGRRFSVEWREPDSE